MAFVRWLLLVLVFAALGACSNSNNLANPSSSTTTATESACSTSTDGLCVSGQFVADQVVSGVNYTCGDVTSMTDDGGFFSCPAFSTIVFSIQAFDTTNVITLGQTTVTPVLEGSVSSTTQTTVGSVVITLADLADIGNTLTDPTTDNQVLNTSRFLNALDDDGKNWEDPNFSGFNSSNRILISDNVRAQLANLPASIADTDFSGSDLTPALKAFVASVPGKSLNDIPSTAVAANHLSAFLNRLPAGAYAASSLGCNFSGLEYIPEGMCNNSGGSQAPKSANLLFFIDHAGYAYGYGMTSTATIVTASPLPVPFYVTGKAVDGSGKLTASASAPLERVIDYTNGNAFSLAALSYTSSDGQTPASQTPIGPILWGGEIRQGAMAATASIYDILYSETLTNTVADNAKLGSWTYGTSSSQPYYVPSGNITLFNVKPANPYLDLHVFDSLSFPVNLKLTFMYDDGTCTTSTTYCATLDSLNVSILKTGDIVTNVNNDCNVIVDPSAAMPVNSSNQSQARVGFVSTVDSSTDTATSATIYTASLTFLLPQNISTTYVPKDLQGIVLGVDSTNLVLLPMNGDSAFTATADALDEWDNFFLSAQGYSGYVTLPNSTKAATSGIVLIQQQSSSQCSSS